MDETDSDPWLICVSLHDFMRDLSDGKPPHSSFFSELAEAFAADEIHPLFPAYLDAALVMINQLARAVDSCLRRDLALQHQALLRWADERRTTDLYRFETGILPDVMRLKSSYELLLQEIRYRLPNESPVRYPPFPDEIERLTPMGKGGDTTVARHEALRAALIKLKASCEEGSAANGVSPHSFDFDDLDGILCDNAGYSMRIEKDVDGKVINARGFASFHAFASLRKSLLSLLETLAEVPKRYASPRGAAFEKLQREFEDAERAKRIPEDFVSRLKAELTAFWVESVERRVALLPAGTSGKAGRKKSAAQSEQVAAGVCALREKRETSVLGAARYVLKALSLVHPSWQQGGYADDEKGLKSLAQAIRRAWEG